MMMACTGLQWNRAGEEVMPKAEAWPWPWLMFYSWSGRVTSRSLDHHQLLSPDAMPATLASWCVALTLPAAFSSYQPP